MAITVDQLKDLVEVPLDRDDDSLQPFLDTAALIRSEDLAGSGLSSGRLDQIELYLAAHFAIVALERGGMERQRQGNSMEQYRIVDGKLTGLNSTVFGQQAIALDTSGTLASSLNANKASFQVVGRSGWNRPPYPDCV